MRISSHHQGFQRLLTAFISFSENRKFKILQIF